VPRGAGGSIEGDDGMALAGRTLVVAARLIGADATAALLSVTPGRKRGTAIHRARRLALTTHRR
jgi:hypothetical protein